MVLTTYTPKLQAPEGWFITEKKNILFRPQPSKQCRDLIKLLDPWWSILNEQWKKRLLVV